MGRSESWKMWAAVIAILLFSGFVAAVWPLVTGLGGGPSGGITLEPETIIITIPPVTVFGFAGQVIELSSMLAFAIIAVMVIGAVILVGLFLSILMAPLSKQVTKVTNSDQFQERNASLEQREKEKLAQKQEGRAAATSQQRDYSHWAVVATSLAVLMFAAFLGLLVAGALFPSGQIAQQDEIINIAGILAGAFALVALFILLLRLNPKRLAAVNETDFEGIPWDTIAIILLGVMVVGLGIGLVVFLNRPV